MSQFRASKADSFKTVRRKGWIAVASGCRRESFVHVSWNVTFHEQLPYYCVGALTRANDVRCVSLCGTINACGLLFNLFCKSQEDLFALCKEISLWYESARLPSYKPKSPKFDIPIAPSVARSNLCHVSSTMWAEVSGHKLLTNEHFERCNRLVADVTMQAVTLLNQYSTAKSFSRKN